MTKEMSTEQRLKRNEYLINAFRDNTIIRHHITRGEYLYFEYGSRKEFTLLITAFKRLGFRTMGIKQLTEKEIDHVFEWNDINENYHKKALLWMSKSSILTDRNYVDWTCTRIDSKMYHRRNPVKFKDAIKLLKEIDKKLKINVD